jgi:hypothetical protein
MCNLCILSFTLCFSYLTFNRAFLYISCFPNIICIIFILYDAYLEISIIHNAYYTETLSLLLLLRHFILLETRCRQTDRPTLSGIELLSLLKNTWRCSLSCHVMCHEAEKVTRNIGPIFI